MGARLRHRRVHDGGSVLRFCVVMGLSVGCSEATRARLRPASRVPSVLTAWDEDSTSRSTWSTEIETISLPNGIQTIPKSFSSSKVKRTGTKRWRRNGAKEL
jgi:hypothetical protein